MSKTLLRERCFLWKRFKLKSCVATHLKEWIRSQLNFRVRSRRNFISFISLGFEPEWGFLLVVWPWASYYALWGSSLMCKIGIKNSYLAEEWGLMNTCVMWHTLSIGWVSGSHYSWKEKEWVWSQAWPWTRGLNREPLWEKRLTPRMSWALRLSTEKQQEVGCTKTRVGHRRLTSPTSQWSFRPGP